MESIETSNSISSAQAPLISFHVTFNLGFLGSSCKTIGEGSLPGELPELEEQLTFESGLLASNAIPLLLVSRALVDSSIALASLTMQRVANFY